MSTGEPGRGRRVGRGTLALAGLAGLVVILVLRAPASGQDEPSARYRTAPALPIATGVDGLRSQRQAFRARLDSVQAEIGRLNRVIEAKRVTLRALDEQVIQAHLKMLAAEHLVYEARRRGLPDLLERQMRASERRRDWERLEAHSRVQIEADASGLLEQLSQNRAEAADLVVDWNLANDRLRLLESPPAARP